MINHYDIHVDTFDEKYVRMNREEAVLALQKVKQLETQMMQSRSAVVVKEIRGERVKYINPEK